MTSQTLNRLAKWLSVVAVALVPAVALAVLPTGENVVSGSATFSSTPDTLTGISN